MDSLRPHRSQPPPRHRSHPSAAIPSLQTQFRALLQTHAITNPHLQRFLAAWPTPTATRPPAANPDSWRVQITVQLDNGRTSGADRLCPPGLHTLNIDLNQLESSQRDRRTILVPFASPDLDGLLAALRNHSIESVEDWHPLDPR